MSNYGGGYGQGGYGGGGGNPYGGNQNPYAQQSNPYDQRGNQHSQQAANPYAQQQNPYSQQQQSNPYAQQGGGYNGGAQGGYGAGNDMEMGQMNGGYNAAPRENPRAVLDAVSDLDAGIKTLDGRLKAISKQQDSVISSANGPEEIRKLDNLNTDTMNLYRNFTQRVKKIKGMPGAGDPQNAPQVGRVERALKDEIQRFQQLDANYRKKINESAVRQYAAANRIEVEQVTPEARQEIYENPNSQMFAQALLNNDRRSNSRSAQQAVQQRHDAIQKIERQVVELAQLFEDMNALVVQQEPVVAQINEQSENVNQDVTNANVQLDGAVKKARAARKKKWICLGIAVLILIIIIIAVAVGVVVTRK